jgi:hypothetical protein
VGGRVFRDIGLRQFVDIRNIRLAFSPNGFPVLPTLVVIVDESCKFGGETLFLILADCDVDPVGEGANMTFWIRSRLSTIPRTVKHENRGIDVW